MADPRIERFARILVDYSMKVEAGDTVVVNGSELAAPLIRAVHRLLLEREAHPIVHVALTGLQEDYMSAASGSELAYLSPVQKFESEHLDAVCNILSSANTRSLSGVAPERQATARKTRKQVLDIILQKRWTLTLYPTEAYAQDADMSLSDFEDFVFGSVFADRDDPVAAWNEIHALQDRLIDRIQGGREVHIVGPGTDIKLSIDGRTFINSDGKHNMPSGEIFTGPVEDRTEGEVTFSFPACYSGREVEGVRLVFREGRVVEATAKKNEEFLHTMLDMDEGGRILGELGIGTNFGISRFTKNILFDEKIGGTIHLAVGSAYPETGGTNKSALHWDMICDLRQGGEIRVDGELFQKDGKFVE